MPAQYCQFSRRIGIPPNTGSFVWFCHASLRARCPDHGGAGILPASFFISVAGLAKLPVLGFPPVVFMHRQAGRAIFPHSRGAQACSIKKFEPQMDADEHR